MEHYSFNKYCDLSRWSSYWYQIKEALEINPKNVLEIGVGDNTFGIYIKANTKIEYKSLDSNKDLHPDFVGDVKNLPFDNNSFDLICAFEILEHLPFSEFENCLKELKRASRKNILISLPHFAPPIKFLLKLPFLSEIKFSFKIPFYKKHSFNGEHYWEIGKRGYPINEIESIMEKHFKILNDYVPFENQYHHFFILEKK